jgi:GntR family transcriptional regulator
VTARKKGIPRYFEIVRDITAAIRGGRLAPGDVVPSENDLIGAYGVSNTTARKALEDLERAGRVQRIKGKGTYVCDSRVDRSATRILGFTQNMVEAGRVPSTKLLSAKVHREGRDLTLNGRRYVLAGPVCEIKRLRLADGIPMMIETRHVSERLCPGIHRKDLEGSLYDIYEREFGLQLARIDQRVSAVIINGKELGFPGISGLIPAFHVEGVTFCAKELVLELEESVYRGDMYRFSVRAMW